MEKFDKVIDFLQSHPEVDFSGGVFNSRNILGDPMKTIYQEDGITIDYCCKYSYIEIFGLNDKEFEKLSNRIWEEVPHYDPEDDIE